MSTEIICALIATGGVLMSGLISWAVSKSAAKNQIEQMKLTWEHDNVVSSDEEFADMTAAVATFTTRPIFAHKAQAISKVAALRSKERGRLGELLDALYRCLESENTGKTNAALTEVINEKRKAHRSGSG